MWWIATGIIIIIVLGFYLIRHRPKKRPVYPYKPANLLPNDAEFMTLLNSYRNKNLCKWLLVDASACMISYDHTIEMIKLQKTSHDLAQQRREELYFQGADNILEIVDGEFYNVQTAFKGFVNSPSHNRIMLNEEVDTCGLSVRQDDDKKYYVTVILFKR